MICPAAGLCDPAVEQSGRFAVSGPMNRGRSARWLAAIAAFAFAAPALGQQSAAAPSLSIDDASAPRLLSAIDLAASHADHRAGSISTRADRFYRIEPGPEAATGKRAKLSVAVGSATLFAIAGKLERNKAQAAPELNAGVARRQPGGGKVYGAGIERRLGKFELGAVYQYSKLTADQPETTSAPRLSGDKSHNLRATLRVRFRP